jgi:hypothetical protein
LVGLSPHGFEVFGFRNTRFFRASPAQLPHGRQTRPRGSGRRVAAAGEDGRVEPDRPKGGAASLESPKSDTFVRQDIERETRYLPSASASRRRGPFTWEVSIDPRAEDVRAASPRANNRIELPVCLK